MIEKTKLPPYKVWAAWESSQSAHSKGALVSGYKGFMMAPGNKKVPYEILDVVPGKCFSILWKAFFVKFVFSHKVESSGYGSVISYDFKIAGPLGWMVRWLIAPKIKANITDALKSFVKNLEKAHGA